MANDSDQQEYSDSSDQSDSPADRAGGIPLEIFWARLDPIED